SAFPAESQGPAPAADIYELHVLVGPGFEAHGTAGDDVQALAPGGATVEVERRIGLGEVEVGADLDGTVGAVGDPQPDRLRAAVDHYGIAGQQDLPGDHRVTMIHRGVG